jgi:hypothetical protein
VVKRVLAKDESGVRFSLSALNWERSEQLVRIEVPNCFGAVENRTPEHVRDLEDGEAGSAILSDSESLVIATDLPIRTTQQRKAAPDAAFLCIKSSSKQGINLCLLGIKDNVLIRNTLESLQKSE